MEKGEYKSQPEKSDKKINLSDSRMASIKISLSLVNNVSSTTFIGQNQLKISIFSTILFDFFCGPMY